MKGNKLLKVRYDDREVGTLALTEGKKAAFEYTEEWIESGFAISPFSLPLEKRVFLPDKAYFGGLFGVFADSIPDAWGNVLLNRMLRNNGIRPDEISVLDRLAIVGDSGMGALRYYPAREMGGQGDTNNLDELAAQCRRILASEESENLDELYRLGGTSGGARPKILTKVGEEDWIIKFPAHVDGADSGKMEYDYACCAGKCGIMMTETRLFPSRECKGYFGTKRFDRPEGGGRVHMCTAAALLELDFTQPSLDYYSLMKLTKILTRENETDVENMYRRMCFNVFAHNRDDHSKNFTYLYDEEEERWRLSPAYDLTFSNTYYGEHTTTVDGNGKNPGMRELIAVGTAAGMPKGRCKEIAGEIKECVEENVGIYLESEK